MTTGKSEDFLAREKKIGMKLHLDVVRAEQRVKFLKKLSVLGVGTNRIEENQIKARKELVKDTGRRVNDIVDEMERKLKDASGKRWRRDSWRKEVETRPDYDSGKVQRMVRRMKTEADVVRKEIDDKNSKSIRFKTKKWEIETKNVKEENLFKNEERLKGYEGISVFGGAYKEENGIEFRGVNVVGNIVLSAEERLVLENNPKLAIISKLDEENLDKELEMAACKVRWDISSNPDKFGIEENDQKVNAAEKDRDVEDVKDKMSEKIEAEARQIYDPITKTLSFSKQKATDSKTNTHIYLPKAAKLKLETGFQFKKEKLMDMAREAVEDMGKVHALKKAEKTGLDSLLKRIKAGEITVMETDKTGKFTVMSQQDYLEAGDLHTANDREISEEELWSILRKLNASNAMFIKNFKVGEAQDHIERHRSNSVCYTANPSNMKLYHKDHKGPGSLATRRINGPGMNVPLSNYIAELLEPIADEIPRGGRWNVGPLSQP